MFIGENVKRLRLKKDLTLQELSQLSTISKSMLSDIENNKKNPSIEIALRLTDALDVTLSALLGREEKMGSEFALYVKESERQVLHEPATGVKRLFISPPLNSNGIDFIFSTAPPNSSSKIFAPSEVPTTKYFYVVQGILNIRVGEQIYKLVKGDSLCFSANAEQHYSSEGPDECHYYIVIHRHN